MKFFQNQIAERARAADVAASMAAQAPEIVGPDVSLRQRVINLHRLVARAMEAEDTAGEYEFRTALRAAEIELEEMERAAAVLLKPQPKGGLKIEGWDL